MSDETWNEEDSELYRRLVDIAVPRREAQIATLLTLAPMGRGEPAKVVELGCGAGALSAAILAAFPEARLTALDGSGSMLDHTRSGLSRYGDRASVEPFDLEASDWRHRLEGASLVVSSLAIHHLDGSQKRALFEDAGRALHASGALLIADLVAPRRREAETLFQDTWDRSAKKRASRGDASRFELFESEKWNIYRYPDPADKPDALIDQLRWLESAGFAAVDCFWLQAGHAIYGGYRSSTRDAAAALTFEDALAIARTAIDEMR